MEVSDYIEMDKENKMYERLLLELKIEIGNKYPLGVLDDMNQGLSTVDLVCFLGVISSCRLSNLCHCF